MSKFTLADVKNIAIDEMTVEEFLTETGAYCPTIEEMDDALCALQTSCAYELGSGYTMDELRAEAEEALAKFEAGETEVPF